MLKIKAICSSSSYNESKLSKHSSARAERNTPWQPHHVANQSLRWPHSTRAGACMAHSKHGSAAAALQTALEI